MNYSAYALDLNLNQLMKIMWVDPFTVDEVEYELNNSNDSIYFCEKDFDIKGNGRNSGLNLSFIRYYNSHNNNLGVCGYGWLTNLDVSLAQISNSVVISDEKGDKFVFQGVYTYPIGVVWSPVSKPNSHKFNEDANYFIFSKKYGNKYFFNKANNNLLEKITDKNGNSIVFNRDSSNKVLSITDNSTRSISFEYNASNQIINTTDPLGRKYIYQYDGNQNLISIENPLGNSTNIEYQDINDIHNITKIILPKGNFKSFQYNTLDQISSISENNNPIWNLTYNNDLNLTNVQNPVGLTIIKQKSEDGKILSVTDNYGTESDEFDLNGYLYKYTDKLGNQTEMTRDLFGNVTTMTNAKGAVTNTTFNNLNRPTQISIPLNYNQSFQYDSVGNLTQYTNSGGAKYTLTWNDKGLVTNFVTPNLNSYNFEYDNFGNVTKIIYPNNTQKQFTYDLVGNLIGVTDQEGFITTFVYDVLNRKYQTNFPDGSSFNKFYDENGNCTSNTNENGNTYSYTYNDWDKINTITDPEGNLRSFTYDSIGRLIKQTDPKGKDVNFTYDYTNRLLSRKLPNNATYSFEYEAQSASKMVPGSTIGPSRYIDPIGNVYQYEYDALYHLKKIIDPNGKSIDLNYNIVDQIISATDQKGNVYQVNWNNFMLPNKLINPIGQERQYTYDNERNLITYADYNGNSKFYTYDALNRVISVQNALGNVISYSYTPRGNLFQLTDQKINVTTYQYNNRNRKTKRIDSAGNEWTYNYNFGGNLTNIIYPDLSEKTYEYNSLELLSKIIFQNGTNITLNYDEKNNLIQLNDWNGSYKQTFDDNNRIISVTNQDGSKVLYEYDLNDNRTKLEAFDSQTNLLYQINYGYNNLDQLSQIGDNNNNLFDFTFDENGNKTSQLSSTGLNTTYNYDPLNRLININTINSQSNTIFQLQYTYDQEFNVISELNNNGLLKTYTYDSIYQLLSANYSDGYNATYTYDPAMNRLTESENGNTTSYTYNNLNQLLQSSGINGVVNYTYDSLGNCIQEASTNQIVDYHYNFLNKVDSITKTGTVNDTVLFSYDGFKRRISKEYSNGNIFNYNYDFYNTLYETSAVYEGGIAYYLSSSIDNILARVTNGISAHYLADNIGSTRGITDTNNQIIYSTDYKPFGESYSGDLGNHHYAFTGREKDFENLYYSRSRNYATDLGRFIQFDTIGVNGGLNLYAYVNNNPINLIDPMGTMGMIRAPSFIEFLWEKFTKIPLQRFLSEIVGIDGTQPFDWGHRINPDPEPGEGVTNGEKLPPTGGPDGGPDDLERPEDGGELPSGENDTFPAGGTETGSGEDKLPNGYDNKGNPENTNDGSGVGNNQDQLA